MFAGHVGVGTESSVSHQDAIRGTRGFPGLCRQRNMSVVVRRIDRMPWCAGAFSLPMPRLLETG